MKTSPTDLDREAATLFRPAGGMRAGWVLEKIEPGTFWQSLRDDSDATPDFYDTDDPATVGVMLAQVRAASGHPCLHVVASDPDPDGAVWWSVPRRFAGRYSFSRTEGAALVAVMRALRASTHAWPRES